LKVTIADANIFIDLFQLNWIDFLFQLELEINTTSLVIYEIKDLHWDSISEYIASSKLVIQELTEDELGKLPIQFTNKGLSVPDKSVLFVGVKLSALVLSGDKALRTEAEKHNLPVHGVLWIFDQLIEKSIVNKLEAAAALRELIHSNPRLPILECNKRLKSWEEGT
jgi:predicted nucleic acid-binding protein